MGSKILHRNCKSVPQEMRCPTCGEMHKVFDEGFLHFFKCQEERYFVGIKGFSLVLAESFNSFFNKKAESNDVRSSQV